MLNKIVLFFNQRFSELDARSLAGFRMILGASILWNLIIYRIPAVGKYYNNPLLVPDETIADYYGPPLPIFSLTDSDLWYYLLMGVMVMAASSMIVGWKTRWMVGILFVLMGSLTTTNPYLSHGVEYLEETALFWSFFLPMDRCWSLRTAHHKNFDRLEGIASFGLLLQLFLIYFSSWLFKNGAVWKEGRVLEIVAQDLIHADTLLEWLSEYPSILQVMTYIGFGLEILISLFLLVGIWKKTWRIYAALSIVLLHFSMTALLDVGTFIIVGVGFAIVLLPDHFWKFIGKSWVFIPTDIIASNFSKSKKNNWLTLGLLLAMLCVLRSNLHSWTKDTYISPVLTSLPFSDPVLEKQIPDPGIFTGFWHQSWRFFAHNIYADLGDFMFVGHDENGRMYDLASGSVISDAVNKAGHWTYLPDNNYQGAEFIFGVYFKFYHHRFPESSKAQWLRLKLDEFTADHEDVLLKRAEIWQIERTYQVQKEVVLSDHYFLLSSHKVGELED
ncbi:hypothetical protein [Nonlabens xiamenensis]|uniref:hypothetical protein n=1 Tax=Nonlabens xiamenensis TaxID=2341043 RepID=UPI000F60CB1A|nr:hypothetical protein [Nonlabens xiamenensis]